MMDILFIICWVIAGFSVAIFHEYYLSKKFNREFKFNVEILTLSFLSSLLGFLSFFLYILWCCCFFDDDDREEYYTPFGVLMLIPGLIFCILMLIHDPMLFVVILTGSIITALLILGGIGYLVSKND